MGAARGPAGIAIPEVVSIFPLPETVLLPGEVLPLHVFEPRYRDLVRDCLGSTRLMGIVRLLPGWEDASTASPPVARTGCTGAVARHKRFADGRSLIWLVGVELFEIRQELDVPTRYRQVRILRRPDRDEPAERARLLPVRRDLISHLRRLVAEADRRTHRAVRELTGATDEQLVASLAGILGLRGERKQRLLDAETLLDRYLLLLEELHRASSTRSGGPTPAGTLN